MVELVKVGDAGYIVNGYNGARSAKNLTKQPKLKAPATYARAKSVFDDVVYDKRFNHPRTRYDLEDHWEASASGTAAAAPKQAVIPAAKPKKEKEAAAAQSARDDAPQPPPAQSDPLGYLDALEL